MKIIVIVLLGISMSAMAHEDSLIVNKPGSLMYIEQLRGPGLLISYGLGGGIEKCLSSRPAVTTQYVPAVLVDPPFGLGGEPLQPVLRTFHMPNES